MLQKNKQTASYPLSSWPVLKYFVRQYLHISIRGVAFDGIFAGTFGSWPYCCVLNLASLKLIAWLDAIMTLQIPISLYQSHHLLSLPDSFKIKGSQPCGIIPTPSIGKILHIVAVAENN